VFHARPPNLPDEDAAWQMQLAGQKLLAEAGFVQYEVSAYARSGKRCRHNMNYWLFGDYLGLGAGAHGKLSLELPQRILRTTKPKQPRDYQEQMRIHRAAAIDGGPVDAGPIGESSFIAAADLPFEFMLNALRLNDGFSVRGYRQRTGLEIEPLEAKLADARGRGLLERNDDGWRPTELGRRFLNDLQASFLV
jgi:oxygen-independent coproporphyrinogen-3 oxidase